MKGCQSGEKSFKVHLDGYNLMPFFKGEAKEAPRKEFLYWSDDGELMAIRVGNWKVAFKEQEHTGLDVWKREFTNLRVPNIYNLRADPVRAGSGVVRVRQMDGGPQCSSSCRPRPSSRSWLGSFKEFPIRQKPASFNLDEVMQALSKPQGSP